MSGRLGRFGLTCAEGALYFLAIKPATDENKPRFTRLPVPPRSLVVALHDHVNALKNIALFVTGKGNDAFQAQDVRPVDLRELVDPGEKQVRIHRPAA